MSVAFFDLDGTLIAGLPSEQRFFAHLLRRRLIGPAQIAAAAGFLARHWPRLGADAARKNKAYLAGLPVAEVARLAEDFVREEIAAALRAEVTARLRAHRAGGERVVLLTGAPDFIARPTADLVGAEAVIATRCAVAEGRFLAAPPTRHPFAEVKRALAAGWTEGAGCTLADCAAYGDSRFDLPLLRAVGRPVAVHPDRALARAARREGWEIIIDGRDGRSARTGRLFASARWM